MSEPTHRRVSHWWREVGLTARRPQLDSTIEADVCVVGAGLTGLWTAYYLKKLDMSLRVAVLEARFAGFGASGRNGGWLTNSVTGGLDQYLATHGEDAAARQQAALTKSVYEVMTVARREAIEADINPGGELIVATNRAQLGRVKAELAASSRSPGTDWEALSAPDVTARVDIPGVLGGMWHPHCATIHPAKLVAGLASVVEGLGVRIYEDSPVEEIRPGSARTAIGSVRAVSVIRATEGFTTRLQGQRRTWLPMNSSMIATQPLPPEVWQEIGWHRREALADASHVYMYAQRTADDRIALGGRGIPYRFASRFDVDGQTPASTVAALQRVLATLFPAAQRVPVAQAWSGVLAVPRDWSSTVTYDPATGFGHAGGYVGTGVTATNLAGRTLADLILGRESDLTTLPWVGHRAQRWEVEPLRWLGVAAIYAAYRAADRAERDGRPSTSRWARIADAVAGRGA
ncbi:FAD-binding oxidoreductase [Phycicoccus sp. Soil803]|uniref:NAD(P)/FAD-dependent oxidoreductase n=1 Tax=Phycicoccus sp. Soil803 TaxID=1736415 RepID=UPI00070A9868|nr:FAD-binding oxidoreductase [Phycicoccus sp. Soil803]KRF21802.1 FAD-dependent oxidoreductase [Phycicoccus sp. Soil803]